MGPGCVCVIARRAFLQIGLDGNSPICPRERKSCAFSRGKLAVIWIVFSRLRRPEDDEFFPLRRVVRLPRTETH